MWRWMWRSVMCVSLVCGLALDSNTIRSSRESTGQSSEQLDRSHDDQVEQASRRQTETNSNSRRQPECSTPECSARGRCSNRAQRRPPPQDREVDRQEDRQVDRQEDRQVDRDADIFNRTKGVEMSVCVRSGDCAAGLCCARYLTGKRCQRIPAEGEACLLRGPTKLRRNLGRCDCGAGLGCSALDRPESGKHKGQGVCVPRPPQQQQQAQRKTRHSGKKRRTAEEGSC